MFRTTSCIPPLLPSKDFVGTSKKGKYGDFIKELDHSTGPIMQAIPEAGLDDNTLVVFTSGNGPTIAGSTGGLNGGKYCTMEGGHRVPGIFRWLGKIPPNQVSDVTLTSMDLLPLFCELAGVEQPNHLLCQNLRRSESTYSPKDLATSLSQARECRSPVRSSTSTVDIWATLLTQEYPT